MKIKLYAKGHDPNVLREVYNDGKRFTSEEHQYAIEKEFGDHFNEKENLLSFDLGGGGVHT